MPYGGRQESAEPEMDGIRQRDLMNGLGFPDAEASVSRDGQRDEQQQRRAGK